MVDLNDLEAIREVDKSGMLRILHNLPNQIGEAKRIVEEANIPKIFKVDHILICGMGGSAISGDILQTYLRRRLSIPVIVNRSYDIPRWVNKNTLVFSQSYSGNTEETLSTFKQAYERHSNIIGISSDGKLEEYCERRNLPYIKIPSGLPPRAAVFYLLFTSLFALLKTGVFYHPIENEVEETTSILKDARSYFTEELEIQENIAKQIAEKINHTIPQIYGWGIYESIAKRWMTQFAENSKIIARYNTFPECTHNDIVAWSTLDESLKKFSCIIFRDSTEENLHMKTRIDYMKKLLNYATTVVEEIHPRGKKSLTKMLYLLYLGDYVSCYLALLNDIDPTPVDAIAELKEVLAKI